MRIALAILFLLSLQDGPKADKDGRIDPKQFKGIVVDDKAAVKTGEWIATTDRKPHVGDGSLHDGGRNRGKCKISFKPDLPNAGRYRVKLVFKPSEELSTKTQIKLYAPVGATHLEINQKAPPGQGPAYQIGVFRFPAGTKSWLEVTNAGADGVVTADAVVFEPVPTVGK